MKPLLPNGYAFDFNQKKEEILKRIYEDNNLEIYVLNSKYFLNLFKKEFKISPAKREKFGIFEIRIAGKIYECFLTAKNYSHSTNELLEQFNKTRGFEAVAGMDELKNQLERDIIWPLQNEEMRQKFKISIPNGILLYGPPGCGKTFIAQKLAEEINFTFIAVKHSDVSSPYIHGGVGKIAAIFEKAISKAPAVVFIDEIEGILPKRDELGSNQSYKVEEINEFLQHLNNAAEKNILVIGATNYIHIIDDAVLRSGRFDKKFLVYAPDLSARISLFEMYLDGVPLDRNVNFSSLARICDGYSCSDIKLICENARRDAAYSGLNTITKDLLENIISNTTPSINSEKNTNKIGFFQ